MKSGCTPLIVLGVLVGLGVQWRPGGQPVEPPERQKAAPFGTPKTRSVPREIPSGGGFGEAAEDALGDALAKALIWTQGLPLRLEAVTDLKGFEALAQSALERLKTIDGASGGGEADRPADVVPRPSVGARSETMYRDEPGVTPRSPLPAATRPGVDAVFNNPFTDAVEQVERYLSQHVHDASSLKVIDWGQVEPVSDGYRVSCRYQSRNVLGKATVQTQWFTLDRQGRVIDVVSQDPPDASSHRVNSP